ncbi:MAG: hypothetical protein HY532_09220 [Chloroflexi bacterium]|nr:hypothetical protein [Chloroflexota bacterium]
MVSEPEAQLGSEPEKHGEATERRRLSPDEISRIWTKVRFNAPFALQEMNASLNFQHWGVAGIAEVAYKKRPPDEIAARTGWKTKGEGAELTIVGDPYGRTDFSEFVVGFQTPFPFLIHHLPNEQRTRLIERAGDERLAHKVLLDSLLRRTLLVVNEVIDGYARVTGSWLVRPLLSMT